MSFVNHLSLCLFSSFPQFTCFHHANGKICTHYNSVVHAILIIFAWVKYKDKTVVESGD